MLALLDVIGVIRHCVVSLWLCLLYDDNPPIIAFQFEDYDWCWIYLFISLPFPIFPQCVFEIHSPI